MKKTKKSRDYYTLNKELHESFIKHIEEKNLNKSKIIESLIYKYMESVNNIDKN